MKNTKFAKIMKIMKNMPSGISVFEIERFEIERGILPRAPTNVIGTELRFRNGEILEIEGTLRCQINGPY